MAVIQTEQDYLAESLAKIYGYSKEFCHQHILSHPCTFPIEESNKSYLVTTLPGRYLVSEPPKKCKVMVVTLEPNRVESSNQQLFHGDWTKEFSAICERVGLDYTQFYYTTALRHSQLYKKATVPKTWMGWSKDYLMEEINNHDPEVILVFGAKALKCLLGSKATVSKYGGTLTDWNGRKIFVARDPQSIYHDPDNRDVITLELSVLANYLNGVITTDDIPHEYVYCYSLEQLESAIDTMLRDDPDYIAIDCEWAGPNAMDGDLRSVQLCWKSGHVIVPVFRSAGRELTPLGLKEKLAWKILKGVVERPKTRLIGHFIRADLPWFVKNGVNVEASVLKGWDTSIAGHLLDENWDQGLEVYVARFTNMGKYERELNDWKSKNEKLVKKTYYEFVPDSILLPYAAKDADATFRVFLVQKQEYEKPDNAALKELFHSICMPVTLPILEIELTGIPVNRDRLMEAARLYMEKKQELKAELEALINWPGFNPDSPEQKIAALFSWFKPGEDGKPKNIAPEGARLAKFVPVKATNKTPWNEVVERNKQAEHRPAGDRDTLLTLGVDHPDEILLKKLLYYSAVSQVCKNFTGYFYLDADGKPNVEKGIIPKLWKDGRAHARIRQLLDTGRYSHKDPNVSQMPKTAEELMAQIFGDMIHNVPSIRSCFDAPPGWCFVDADWKSAELFVMAWLSGDKAMQEVLLDFSRDFHAETAMKMFKLAPVPIDWTGDQKSWLKKNGWSKYRTIAKTIAFGIAYGRGPRAIKRAVYKEGVNITDEEAKDAVMAFKRNYPDLAKWLNSLKMLVRTQHYVENAFGRRRRFPLTDDQNTMAGFERKGMNQPVQGTVGDLMSMALFNLYAYRAVDRPDLQYKIVMSVHDQILLMCPISQIKDTVQAIKICMEDRSFVPGVNLHLFADPEVSLQWAVPLTKEAAQKAGIPLEYATK